MTRAFNKTDHFKIEVFWNRAHFISFKICKISFFLINTATTFGRWSRHFDVQPGGYINTGNTISSLITSTLTFLNNVERFSKSCVFMMLRRILNFKHEKLYSIFFSQNFILKRKVDIHQERTQIFINLLRIKTKNYIASLLFMYFEFIL